MWAANGTGKSSLLKVRAGLEAWIRLHRHRRKASSIGYMAGMEGYRFSGPAHFRGVHDRVRDLRALEDEQEQLARRDGRAEPGKRRIWPRCRALPSPEGEFRAARICHRRAGGSVLSGPPIPQRGLEAATRVIFRRLEDAHRARQAAAQSQLSCSTSPPTIST